VVLEQEHSAGRGARVAEVSAALTYSLAARSLAAGTALNPLALLFRVPCSASVAPSWSLSMEFKAPSQLGKRPRGYVPDDVAARRRGGGGGGGDDSDEEGGGRGAPKSGTERAVEAALAAEAAAKDQSTAAKQAAKKAAKKSVSFKEPADEDDEEAPEACMTAVSLPSACPRA
jgi:hypothetical protein